MSNQLLKLLLVWIVAVTGCEPHHPLPGCEPRVMVADAGKAED